MYKSHSLFFIFVKRVISIFQIFLIFNTNQLILVQNHIFGAVKFWIEEFKIDGIRLDAADVLSDEFLKNLGSFCRSIKNDFWLMGEVVHGDYNKWCNSEKIDSVTNYQLYKGMWSSFNCANMFEVAWSLKEQLPPY